MNDAAAAKREFIIYRAKMLAEYAGERRTKHQVMDAVRRRYALLLDRYLRTNGTTYAYWLDHGPKPEWDEIDAAMLDDAVWDRLVSRCVDTEHVRP